MPTNVDIIWAGGTAGLLFFMFWVLWQLISPNGKLVSREQYDKEVQRGDKWEAAAMRGSNIIPRQTKVAEELVPAMRESLALRDTVDKLAEELALLRQEKSR